MNLAFMESSLRAAFPDLSAYFDTVFPFMRTADAEVYSFLFAQVSAQIKHGADVNATPKQLFPLWKYLLDKQVQRHYLTSAQAQEVLAEMSKWVKKQWLRKFPVSNAPAVWAKDTASK